MSRSRCRVLLLVFHSALALAVPLPALERVVLLPALASEVLLLALEQVGCLPALAPARSVPVFK